MDFGATVCKPKQPLCSTCVQNKDCEAYKHGWINDLPIKEKVLQKKSRWFTYFLVEVGDKVYIRQRTANDIWQNLYEFVVREANGPEYFNEDALRLIVKRIGAKSVK
jgi:A/G-specific adenine glycosylase